jgi:hypothetical protein
VSEAGEEQQQNNSNNNDQQQPPIIQDNESAAQDFSKPLSPAEAIIGKPVIAEPELAPLCVYVAVP